MNLDNIDEAEKFKPFLDAIETNEKIKAGKIIKKGTKKIYWNLIEYGENFIEMDLEINLNKYETDTLYIPYFIPSNYGLNLNISIKTNASKIILENIVAYNKDDKDNKYKYDDEGKYSKEATCNKLTLEGFTQNSIKEIDMKDAQGIEQNLLNLSNNKSITKLKCKNFISNICIDNTEIKTLDCYATKISAENSKLEEIENKEIKTGIFASNSNLKTINKNGKEIDLHYLDAENTPLEYVNLSSKATLRYLNIKNTKQLPEEIEDKLILSIINNKDRSVLKRETSDEIIFYNEENIKGAIYKCDMELNVLITDNIYHNNRIMSLEGFKNYMNYFGKPENFKKAFSSYKKLTKNTNLILMIMKLNEAEFKENSFIDAINKEISKYSHSQINQRNIYGKSAICYVNELNIFQNLIKSGYEIIENDLPYLTKNKNQSIVSFTENLIIKKSIMNKSLQKTEMNVQKKNINKNVL